MRIILLAIISICSAALFFSCSGNKPEEKKVSDKRDSSHINPFHPPDSIPLKHGAIGADADTSFRQFAFVANNKYVILSMEPDTNWAGGAHELSEGWDGGLYAAITPVKKENLPAAYSSLLGKEFKGYDANGNSYALRIEAFKLLSAYIPHFGTVQAWNGMEDEGVKALSDNEKANAIWNEAALFLVAEFSSVLERGRKEEIVFASFNTVDIHVWHPDESGKSLITEEQIHAKADLTKEYVAAQEDFHEADTSSVKWWKSADAMSSFRTFSLANNSSYGILSDVAGNPCGGDFYKTSFSLWDMNKKSAGKLVYMADKYWSILAVLDMDADGIPELLVDDGFGKRILIKKEATDWVEYYIWSVPFMDCPC